MKPVMRPPDHARQQGFTIIETMVACVLLLVGLVATLTIVEQAASTTNKTRAREQGTNLQRELIEGARSVSYDELKPDTAGAAVSARPALGDSSGSAGWTIRRRNATYTVSVGVCTVDDPRDGIGAEHAAGIFCADNGPPPTAEQCATLISAAADGTLASVAAAAGVSVGRCGIDANLDGTVDDLVSTSLTVCVLSPCTTPADPNPADYKRVVSLVRWPGGYNLQTSQINNPGPAAAPAVESLTAPSLTEPYTILEGTPTPLRLDMITTNAPKTVQLYLDGSAIELASNSPSGSANWTASWNLGAVDTTPGAQPRSMDPPAISEIVDGSYQVSAKAFDQYGQYGATRSQTIKVNRRRHFAPTNLNAGRNGAGVEIEWSPAKEHDSEGFSVERRVDGGTWEQVCARAVRTACRDGGAPPIASMLEYSVVGHDRNPAGALRAGDSAPYKIIDPAPLLPGMPGLGTDAIVNGNTVLTWTAPAGETAPDHYNIYRDGLAYGNRLESLYFSAGQPLTFTDTRTGGVAHDYWVTAVNSRLGESDPLGPVRR